MCRFPPSYSGPRRAVDRPGHRTNRLEVKQLTQPQRWGVWLSVKGDLRFASHRDTMQAVELAASRAAIPLQYTQGFNPHPRLSMPCPRPVGVATLDDLVVIILTEPVEATGLLERLNAQAPEGMHFTRAEKLSATPQPVRMHCELPVKPEQLGAVRDQLAQLQASASWPVRRAKKPRARRGKTGPKTVDIKPLVEAIDLNQRVLRITLTGCNGRWARPAEVLDLIGLDRRADLASLVRSQVEYTT